MCSDGTIAVRRTRRLNRQLPIRFRVPLPQPLPLDPPAAAETELEGSCLPGNAPNLFSTEPEPNTETPLIDQPDALLPPLKKFATRRNIFGLFRRYFSSHPPTHDPEEYLELEDLSDGQDLPTSSGHQLSTKHPQSFSPYPNQSSFLLGEWYHANGQKSQRDFSNLVKIVGSPTFRSEDVHDIPWGKINSLLASSDAIADDEEDHEWLDETSGWKTTTIRISVPFHRRATNPGPKDYVAGKLYHRSLVSVIREKLVDKKYSEGFHYEPFELFWQPGDLSTKTRVHGELYTSPSFTAAHERLQNSPGEPGCILPKVVVAMMFWSDVTHLTSFGNAKLWPCYLYFGNESKYRRCKPSNHLSNHVAYFQTVHKP